jgi:hypothetical protein
MASNKISQQKPLIFSNFVVFCLLLLTLLMIFKSFLKNFAFNCTGSKIGDFGLGNGTS